MFALAICLLSQCLLCVLCKLPRMVEYNHGGVSRIDMLCDWICYVIVMLVEHHFSRNGTTVH